MTDEDRKFFHDIMNKLAKIAGFSEILKLDLEEGNSKIIKIENSTREAIELITKYRAHLEKDE